MSYRDLIAADVRLVLLRLLAELPAYEANSSVLREALERYGHCNSRDQVHTELAWLAEQGLVTTREIASVVIAMLTTRGLDVAHGRAVVPGVRRPGPIDGP